MTPELRGIELSVQSDVISLKVTRFNPSLVAAHDRAMRALAILLSVEEASEKPAAAVLPEVNTEVIPDEALRGEGSEPSPPIPAAAPAAPAMSPNKHQLCWTPERRKALAERMKGNHIRRDSVKPSAEKPAAGPPLANDASGKDYRSPNSVWKGTGVPAP